MGTAPSGVGDNAIVGQAWVATLGTCSATDARADQLPRLEKEPALRTQVAGPRPHKRHVFDDRIRRRRRGPGGSTVNVTINYTPHLSRASPNEASTFVRAIIPALTRELKRQGI
jgi:hypothetical protein